MCSTSGGDDSSHEPQAGPRQSWANLTQPGPLGWKLQRLVANTFTKLLKGQSCCGNHGEPGC
jgi:hypothetical protein